MNECTVLYCAVENDDSVSIFNFSSVLFFILSVHVPGRRFHQPEWNRYVKFGWSVVMMKFSESDLNETHYEIFFVVICRRKGMFQTQLDPHRVAGQIKWRNLTHILQQLSRSTVENLMTKTSNW